MKLEEEDLVDIIKKQNKIDEGRESFYIKAVKEIIKNGKNDNIQSGGRKIEDFLITEVTHKLMLKRKKINIHIFFYSIQWILQAVTTITFSNMYNELTVLKGICPTTYP